MTNAFARLLHMLLIMLNFLMHEILIFHVPDVFFKSL